jgi:ribosomal-protein-alanine N-acetyltransferase
MALRIVTDRLELRPYAVDDVPVIHAVLYGDAEAMRLIGGAVDLEEARRRIEVYISHQRSAGYAFWAVVERATGALAGEAGLIPFGGEGPDVELGYAFGRAFWGRGLATEAARAVLAEAFGPLGLKRVVAVTKPANLGSQRVLAKLGFVPAGRRQVWDAEQLYYVASGPAHDGGSTASGGRPRT